MTGKTWLSKVWLQRKYLCQLIGKTSKSIIYSYFETVRWEAIQSERNSPLNRQEFTFHKSKNRWKGPPKIYEQPAGNGYFWAWLVPTQVLSAITPNSGGGKRLPRKAREKHITLHHNYLGFSRRFLVSIPNFNTWDVSRNFQWARCGHLKFLLSSFYPAWIFFLSFFFFI